MANDFVERLLIATPSQTARQRIIASPFQFWVDANTNLRLEGWTSALNVTVTVHGQFLNESGELEVLRMDVPVTNNFLRASRDYALARGFLTNVVAVVTGAAPLVGQVFTRISLIRGLSGATFVLGTLLQGYITSQQGLAWPGSPLADTDSIDGYHVNYGIAGASPGNAMTLTVPTGLHWKFLNARATISTDATAVNRRPYVAPSTGGSQYFAHHPAVVGASTSRVFYWAQGLTGNVDTTAVPSTGALPTRTELDGADLLVIGATNLQAGDQFIDGSFNVLERLQVA